MSSLRESPSALQSGSRAVTYCRVSTAEQSEHGYSLEAQAADCRKLAEELAATVVAEFSDADSGASWDLPGLNAVLDAAKRREFDILLCYDPDRLARRMAKQLVIEEELKRAGVSIRYVTLRIGDSAEDNLLKNVRSSIAEYERAKIALRTSRGRRAKAERGLVVGNGVAPYGYEFTRNAEGRVAGLEPRLDLAPIVQRIFAEVCRLPVLEVCRRLNADGIPTYFDSSMGWASSTILGILDNPVYLGTAAYGRRDTAKKFRDAEHWLYAAVPPLVDRSVWDNAHRALSDRKTVRRTRGPESEDQYQLRGLLTCAHCGGLLACTPNNGYLYYKCLRNEPARARDAGKDVCPLPAVYAEAIEQHIWDRITQTPLNPEQLEQGLAAAQSQHTDAAQRRRDRAQMLDRDIARLRTRLTRITAERLDADPGSEQDLALRAVAEETERTIRPLAVERNALEAEPPPGLSGQDVQALQQFAEQVRQGLDLANPAERRQVFELLQLRARVQCDEKDGVKLGRRHRYRVELFAVVEIPDLDKEYKKVRLRYYANDLDDWELEHLGVPSVAR
ncbi:MAG: recombinase family protein [Chloroflexi bacterium]|nr:recombinase family protein [Chloroflexota bacterium]